MGDKQPRPGKDSGVTGEDLSKAPDVGQVAPGKTNLTQSMDVGDELVDHDAYCREKDDSTAGCFLTDRKRDLLMLELVDRCNKACENFKIALVELRVDELMKKDNDTAMIVLGIVLEFGGAFVGGAISTALIALKAKQLRTLGAATVAAVQRGAASSTSERVEQLLMKITDDQIKAKVKAAGGFAVKQAEKGAHDAAHGGEKEVVLSYIDQLKDGADFAYTTFSTNAMAKSTDAELVVLWEGMDVRNHTPGLYKARLGEKIERFRHSGVPHIGREYDEKKYRHDIADRRVVWVAHADGSKTLFFQKHQTSDDLSTVREGEPDTIAKEVWADHKDTFGEMGKAATTLDGQVPREFWDQAEAAHEARWHTPIAIIADPFAIESARAHAQSYAVRMSAARYQQPPPVTSAPVRTDVRIPDDQIPAALRLKP